MVVVEEEEVVGSVVVVVVVVVPSSSLSSSFFSSMYPPPPPTASSLLSPDDLSNDTKTCGPNSSKLPDASPKLVLSSYGVTLLDILKRNGAVQVVVVDWARF